MAHFPVSKWSLCSRFFFLANIMAKPDLPTTWGSRASTPPPTLAGKAAWEESRLQGRPEGLERAVKTLKEQVTTVARGGWRALERNNSAAEGLSPSKGATLAQNLHREDRVIHGHYLQLMIAALTDPYSLRVPPVLGGRTCPLH